MIAINYLCNEKCYFWSDIYPWIWLLANCFVLLNRAKFELDWTNHGLRTPSEEIAFTARPKIHSHSQIFRYSRSIFCLPHRPKFSDFFELCLHWVSVVRALKYLISKQYEIIPQNRDSQRMNKHTGQNLKKKLRQKISRKHNWTTIKILFSMYIEQLNSWIYKNW